MPDVLPCSVWQGPDCRDPKSLEIAREKKENPTISRDATDLRNRFVKRQSLQSPMREGMVSPWAGQSPLSFWTGRA